MIQLKYLKIQEKLGKNDLPFLFSKEVPLTKTSFIRRCAQTIFDTMNLKHIKYVKGRKFPNHRPECQGQPNRKWVFLKKELP